jgi:hypothetical protein
VLWSSCWYPLSKRPALHWHAVLWRLRLLIPCSACSSLHHKPHCVDSLPAHCPPPPPTHTHPTLLCRPARYKELRDYILARRDALGGGPTKKSSGGDLDADELLGLKKPKKDSKGFA